MSDRPVTDPDDLPEVDAAFEAASARHDGEGSAADDVDAAAESHLGEVASVAGRVGDVPAPPAGTVDDHVAAALAAFDEAVELDEPELDEDGRSPTSRVIALAERRPWWQRAPLGAVAAAVAVVALVGAIGFAAVSDGDTDDDAATAALDSGDSAGDDASTEAFDAGATSGGAASSALNAAERESFASFDELADVLAQRAARAEEQAAEGDGGEAPAEPESDEAAAEDSIPTDPAPTSGGAAGCDAFGAARIDPATVEDVRSVVVADQLITAVVHDVDGERRLTAVDEATCSVADERSL